MIRARIAIVLSDSSDRIRNVESVWIRVRPGGLNDCGGRLKLVNIRIVTTAAICTIQIVFIFEPVELYVFANKCLRCIAIEVTESSSPINHKGWR